MGCKSSFGWGGDFGRGYINVTGTYFLRWPSLKIKEGLSSTVSSAWSKSNQDGKRGKPNTLRNKGYQ